jgi:GAF domain-containing protein
MPEYDLFLSYHGQDAEDAKKIAGDLGCRGLRVFADRWYLQPGPLRRQGLTETIAASSALAILIGKRGLSRWQRRELHQALLRSGDDAAFAVLPVLRAGDNPPLNLLKFPIWLDLRADEDYASRLEALASIARDRRHLSELGDAACHSRLHICPYRGLRNFREEDSDFYFGRDDVAEQLLATLNSQDMVAVVGSSGSGKSSLMRAGLVPRLRRADPATIWEVVAMRPGEHPAESLRGAFMPLLEPRLDEAERARRVSENAGATLQDIVGRVLRQEADADRLLLIIDQWEEIYSLTDEGSRRRFITELLSTANRDCKVVLGLRGDAYGHVTRDRELSDRLQGALVNAGPMRREELRAAIIGPAEKAELDFDEGLIDSLLDDVGDEPANLPLLEFVLQALWQSRGGRRLLNKEYAELGGLHGAIARRAAVEYGKLGPNEREITRRSLLRLISIGEGEEIAGRRVALHSFGADARAVIARLAAARLLVVNWDPLALCEMVELGHEALIGSWAELHEWVEAEREFSHTLRRVRDAASDWRRRRQDPDWLLPGGRQTAEAAEFLESYHDRIEPEVVQYIEASIAKNKQQEADEITLRFYQTLKEIETANWALPNLERTFEKISEEIKNQLNFDFVALQLKNKEEQTIETVYGTGSSADWSGLAKHSILADEELRDIQADIVQQRPPRIEIIAGRDRRFDEYIFEKFEHEKQVRVFAPIIVLRNSENPAALHWDLREDLPPNTDAPRDGIDRRTVLQARREEWDKANGQGSEVIGTIEAGFADAGQEISRAVAERVAVLAAERAGKLYDASLDNVFETIANGAMTIIGADAGSLHFDPVQDRVAAGATHYVYEAWAGHPFQSAKSPRANGLGQQALQQRRALWIPDRDRGHHPDYLREFHREAYDEGVMAEAAIPIFFSEESDALYSDSDAAGQRPEKQGLLYVRFTREHWFTEQEIDWLRLFGDRATQAIRIATSHTKERNRVRRLANMNHIARSLADHPASPWLLPAIAGVALNIMAADIVSVYEYDEKKAEFLSNNPSTAGRLIEKALTEAPSFDERSAPTLLLKTRENIFADDAAANETLSAKRGTALYARSFVARERVKSAAALILRGEAAADGQRIRQEMLGMMFVNYRTPHHFTPEDIKVAETLASSAAIAIRNRRQRSLDDRLDRIERALVPPPLLNYHGYLACRLRDASGKELVLGDDRIIDLSSDLADATIQLMPTAPAAEIAASRLAVSGDRDPIGDDEMAQFEVEVIGDEIDADPPRVRLQATTTRPSKQEAVRLTLSGDAGDEVVRLRLYVTQAGRYVGVLQIPIRLGPAP